MLVIPIIGSFLFVLPSFAAPAQPQKKMKANLDLIADYYGPDIARIYETVDGMPVFDLNSEKPLTIKYRKNAKPCNEIFLRENPEMAEDCQKVRETVTFITQHKKRVRTHIKEGRITSIDMEIPMDERNPLKTRSILLLHDALIFHDCVLDRYSQNHAKIFHFPAVTPSVELDSEHNLTIHVGQKDFIKFRAENFRMTECRGFKVYCSPKLYRNGTRAIPDVSYDGQQPHMVAVNWSYPPLTGQFTLYDGHKKVGAVPATLLYKKLRNGRARPLFKNEGLLNYLVKRYQDGSLKKYYGADIYRFVERLIEEKRS
jgi:hypothetical protein